MASADQILSMSCSAKLADMRRRLDSKEIELRGLKAREDGSQANRYGGEGKKGKPPVFAGDKVETCNE